MLKVLPLSFSLPIRKRPRCRFTMRFTMTSPSPVPSCSRERLPSTRQNRPVRRGR